MPAAVAGSLPTSIERWSVGQRSLAVTRAAPSASGSLLTQADENASLTVLDVVPGFGDAWIHCAFERAHGAAHSIQTVGDAMELPWLLAPIPGDRNGRTSHFFEQLLVQWRRQRSAEEAADQRMRQPRPPTCGSGSSDEQNPDDHNRAPAAARLARAQAFLDAGRAADALVTFETLLPDVNDNEGSAAGQHKQAEAEGGDVG